MSALQMLASFSGQATAQQQPAAAPQPVAGRVGTWTATLPNKAVVQLRFEEGGSFVWIANNNGKQSSFSGKFADQNGSLTLTRTDGQKLTGALVANGANGFSFKLQGAKDNGLQFARQS